MDASPIIEFLAYLCSKKFVYICSVKLKTEWGTQQLRELLFNSPKTVNVSEPWRNRVGRYPVSETLWPINSKTRSLSIILDQSREAAKIGFDTGYGKVDIICILTNDLLCGCGWKGDSCELSFTHQVLGR